MVGFYVTGTYSYWLKLKFRYFKYLRSHCVEQRIEFFLLKSNTLYIHVLMF